MVFSTVSEIEKDLISKRTKEANRVKLGRPKGPRKSKPDAHKLEIEALLKNGSTKKIIAHRYNSTPANLHNWIQKTRIQDSPN